MNTKHYFYKQKAFISPFLMIIFSLYLTVISFYITQYSLKLKTTHNLEKIYKEVIVNKLIEVDVIEKSRNTNHSNRIHGNR
ncbi:hypothetical protein D3P10_06350 [Staphylococcus warneri]|nr:hypothetical protein D3P10_06350 [Staphylococcus warneri]